MRLHPTTIACGAAAVLLTGCFDPEFGSGNFRCNPADGDNACPSDYSCSDNPNDPGDFRCKLTSELAKPKIVEFRLLSATLGKAEKLGYSIKVENMKFAPDKLGASHVEGEGHAHIFFDEKRAEYQVLPRESGTVELPAFVTSGSHKATVFLVHNNHNPYQGSAEASATFNVR